MGLNILLVTDLFPEDQEMSRKVVSYALYDFVKEWKAEGNEVTVIRPIDILKRDRNKKLPVLNEIDGIRILTIKALRIPKIDYWLFWINKNLIEKYQLKTDILLCHLITGLKVGIILKKYFNVPLIFGVHNSTLFHLNVLKTKLDKVDALVFRSPSIFKHYIEKLIIDCPYTYALSGIDSDYISNRISNYWNCNTNRKVKIITIASLIKLKNIDAVIKALDKLPESIDWSYTIVGDGPEKKYLEKLTHKFGINNRIRFLGHRSHKECLEILENNDIFIMISAPETFGLVYLEAMAKGLVVIGSKGWGIDGIIQNGLQGYLISPGSSEELLALLLQVIMKDQNLLIEKAKELISKMTQKEMAKKYMSFIQQIVNKQNCRFGK